MPVPSNCPICGAPLPGDGYCIHCGAELPRVPGDRGASGSATDLGSGPPASGEREDAIPSAIGRFPVIRRLGKGGMGSVYLARDPKLDRLIALKVPHDGQDLQRFLREARSAARFHHPNFCPIHEVGDGEDGAPAYLAMTYIDGRPLSDSIVPGDPWEPRKAAEVVRQLATALAEAHRSGIVHRDLKPANVMVDARGNLVLMDFGLARRIDGDDPRLTVSGAIMGTPAYMSPEQAEADFEAIGPRSDIYNGQGSQ